MNEVLPTSTYIGILVNGICQNSKLEHVDNGIQFTFHALDKRISCRILDELLAYPHLVEKCVQASVTDLIVDLYGNPEQNSELFKFIHEQVPIHFPLINIGQMLSEIEKEKDESKT